MAEKLKWETKKVKVRDLIELDINPRKISDAKKQKLIESLEKFNLAEIPAVNTDMQIIGGNQRVSALMMVGRGDEEIDVRVPNRKLTKKEVKEYAIISNTHAGEFDFEILELEFADVQIEEIGFDVIGFDDWKKKQDIALASEAKEDDFDVPVGGIETDIVLGDLFEIGEHRLLCGDSTDSEQVAKLMNGEKADMVFTDPPFPNNSEIMHEMIKNIDSAFNNSRIFCDGLMIWFWDNLEFPPFLEQVTSKHIWHKTNGWQAGHFETMYCYHNDSKRHEQKVYSINNVGGENNREEQGNHPTPKPISLVFNIVNDLSKNSKLILDLFLGSGTTMVAAHQLNRKCYGMELDCKYVEVIVTRMIKLDKTLIIKRNGIEETQKWLNKIA